MELLKIYMILITLFLQNCNTKIQKIPDIELILIAKGWANNTINTVIFRKNSITHYNNNQYVAFYDSSGEIVIAKRRLGSKHWQIRKTGFYGNIKDAHNSISIITDGEGYIHMSWNQHNSTLNYVRSLYPDSLIFSDKIPMTGINENKVTYPQFFKLPDGNLIFIYRDGSSGNGNVSINYYNKKVKKWTKLHTNLIDGEGKRNAYWQAYVDNNGTIHISWTWRESWDVATNHDICYARSEDLGKTWKNSKGEIYSLPITVRNAEYCVKIPQNSCLINQTSMCTDNNGNPYIATYFKNGINNPPEYHIIYKRKNRWKITRVYTRKYNFSLSGGGTKKIPISRPLLLCDNSNNIYMIFRDKERKNVASIARCSIKNLNKWEIFGLTNFSVGMWEPTADIEYWKKQNILYLFIQHVGQGDQERLENIGNTTAYLLKVF